MSAASIFSGSLVTWALLLGAISALGFPVGLAFSRSITPQTIRIALWSGLLILVVSATLTNLFLPLKSIGALAVLLGVLVLSGIAVFLILRKKELTLGGLHFRGWRTLPPSGWVLVGGLVVVSLWWLIGATRAPTNYDSGLYHIQAIWYTAEFTTIPGLTNLYHSYGFSNSLNSFAGVISNGPLGLDSYRAANGFFFLLLSIEIILRLVSGLKKAVGTKILIIALPIFVAPMVLMVDYWVTSPTFDTPVAIMTFISFAALADSLTRSRVCSVDVTLALLPLALAASMRQHYWFLFGFAFLILGCKIWKSKNWGRAGDFAISSIGATVLFSVMIARDYFLSGWVMYPYKTFSFNVGWLAPDPSGLIDSGKQWARSSTPAYQQASEGWWWIRPWLGANLTSWVFLAILGCLTVALVALVVLRKVWRPRVLVLVLVPQVLFLAIWFFLGAPHVRYVWGPLLLMGAAPLAWMWIAWERSIDPRAGLMKLALSASGLGLVGVVVIAGTVVLPRLDVDMPAIAIEEVPLSPSINLLVPQGTDQCWENYPVCSGLPAQGLAARGNSVADGFEHHLIK